MNESSTQPPRLNERLGAAALGLLAGLFIGLVIGLTATMINVFQEIRMADLAFGTAALLAALSFTWPALAFGTLTGLSHLFFGLFEETFMDATFKIPAAEHSVPRWLKFMFYTGVATGALLLAISYW